ncbi:DUF4937 domain-containing protein [Bacillus sp. CGMCC 1.16607]|uniref:DUF4937 domain-containing protein n=1 Tax=Bacillus sp. CGMCC 1.16607 TaxID=3351842 RepID=UPI00364547C1
MIIKWIKVEVPIDKKIPFSQAQEFWNELKSMEGFLGQAGGWNQNKETEACIVAFWKDYNSYKVFMNDYHDDIYERSKQRGTFDRITTSVYQSMFMINDNNPTKILSQAQILRVAECIVHREKQEHFTSMQEQVWNPEMSTSTGFLSGVFCKAEKADTEYFVSSFWESKEFHEQYIVNKLALLREKSQVSEDLIDIHGTIVDLNEAWLVVNPNQ